VASRIPRRGSAAGCSTGPPAAAAPGLMTGKARSLRAGQVSGLPSTGDIAAEYVERADGPCGARGGPPARRRASRASGSPGRPARRTRRARLGDLAVRSWRNASSADPQMGSNGTISRTGRQGPLLPRHGLAQAADAARAAAPLDRSQVRTTLRDQDTPLPPGTERITGWSPPRSPAGPRLPGSAVPVSAHRGNLWKPRRHCSAQHH
jgi:hypothetical protein